MQFEKVMRKYVLLALCSLGLLNSCFKDDSTVAKEENRAPQFPDMQMTNFHLHGTFTAVNMRQKQKKDIALFLSGKRKLWFILLS